MCKPCSFGADTRHLPIICGIVTTLVAKRMTEERSICRGIQHHMCRCRWDEAAQQPNEPAQQTFSRGVLVYPSWEYSSRISHGVFPPSLRLTPFHLCSRLERSMLTARKAQQNKSNGGFPPPKLARRSLRRPKPKTTWEGPQQSSAVPHFCTHHVSILVCIGGLAIASAELSPFRKCQTCRYFYVRLTAVPAG